MSDPAFRLTVALIIFFIAVAINAVYRKIKKHFDDIEYMQRNSYYLNKENKDLKGDNYVLIKKNDELKSEIQTLKDKIRNYYRT